MRANLDRIDFAAAEAKEREIRHDVMAHVHAFGLACPRAEPIIHLGATSECVCGNADLMLYREALALECLQDAGVRRGVGAAPGEREVEGLHGSSLSW